MYAEIYFKQPVDIAGPLRSHEQFKKEKNTVYNQIAFVDCHSNACVYYEHVRINPFHFTEYVHLNFLLQNFLSFNFSETAFFNLISIIHPFSFLRYEQNLKRLSNVTMQSLYFT